MTFKRPAIGVLAAIFVVAFILRFLGLGMHSFWLDEAFSVRNATPVLERVDIHHPPLYYMLVHATLSVLGRSEAAIRLPSAIFSFLSVGLLYALGRRLLDRETSLLAAALLAVSPLNVWYAREARMYAPTAFLALLMAFGLAWNHWAGFFLFFLALSAGLYLSYLTPALWLGLSALWLVMWLKQGRKLARLAMWLAASMAALLFYRPWWAEFTRWAQGRHWIAERLRQLLNVPSLSLLHLGLVALPVAAGLVAVALVMPRVVAQPRRRRTVTALMIVGFIGVGVLVPIPRLYGAKRILVTGWAFVILFLAWLISQTKQYRAAIAALLLAISLASSLASAFITPKDDWRGVTGTLRERAPDAVVWVDPFWNFVAYDYYDAEREVLHENVAELARVAEQQGELWLVAERFHGQAVPSSASEAWLNSHMTLVDTIPFYRLELRLYRDGP